VVDEIAERQYNKNKLANNVTFQTVVKIQQRKFAKVVD